MNAEVSETCRPGPGRWLGPTALLAAAAALVSFWLAGFGLLEAYRQTLSLSVAGSGVTLAQATLRRLTPDQRLVLTLDASGLAALVRARALWGRWPTNPVYFHNLLTVALANYEALGTNEPVRYEALQALVEQGRPLDPGNARLDWILAAKRMDPACAFKSTVAEAAGTHGATVRSELVVSNRVALDDAMRLLTAGLAAPTYRRYSRELMAEREALLGPPRTLPQIVQRLAVAAATQIPDVTVQRNLARGATAYASLLLAEGRTNEAVVYLNAWRPLGLRLNEDAFTLIDALMVGAVFKEAELKAPELVRIAQGPAEAARMRDELASLTRPLREWKARRDRAESDPAQARRLLECRDRSGVLLAMLLPALGEVPPEAALRPSRMQDYLLLDHACLGGVAALLTFGLLVVAMAGLTAARRVGPLGAGPAEALRPAALAVFRGVLLPVAVYLALAWLTPLGGRELGLQRAWPKAVMQAGLLMAVIVGLLHHRMVRWAGSDLAAGEGRLARLVRVGRRVRAGALGVLAAVSLFPVAWLYTTEAWGAALALAPLVVLVVSGLGSAALAGLAWRTDAARLAGCVARVAMPAVLTLALAVLLLNLGARSLLSWEERRLAAGETLIQVDAEIGGFTVVEARLARELRDGVLQAAAVRGRPGSGEP